MTGTECDAATGTGTEGGNVLRRNSDDVGWEYGVLVDPNNKDKVKCILCDKVMFGGVYRVKQHVAGKERMRRNARARRPPQRSYRRFKKSARKHKIVQKGRGRRGLFVSWNLERMFMCLGLEGQRKWKK